MVRDTLLLRSCALQMSEMNRQMNCTDLPSPSLIRDVFESYDWLLRNYGDVAYTLVKEHETICVGLTLKHHDSLSRRDEFLNHAEESVRDDLIAGGVQPRDAHAGVRRFIETISRAVPLRHKRELYGLNKAWGYAAYAHIDVPQSFEKARDLMTKTSAMSDHGRRVVLEAR
eukprot:6466316-Amphidinium_carterae.1